MVEGGRYVVSFWEDTTLLFEELLEGKDIEATQGSPIMRSSQITKTTSGFLYVATKCLDVNGTTRTPCATPTRIIVSGGAGVRRLTPILFASNSATGAYMHISLDSTSELRYSVFDPLYTPLVTLETQGAQLADDKWHHIVHVINPPPIGIQIFVDGMDRADVLLDNARPDSSVFFRSAWNIDALTIGGKRIPFEDSLEDEDVQGEILLDDFAIWETPLTRHRVLRLQGGGLVSPT